MSFKVMVCAADEAEMRRQAPPGTQIIVCEEPPKSYEGMVPKERVWVWRDNPTKYQGNWADYPIDYDQPTRGVNT